AGTGLHVSLIVLNQHGADRDTTVQVSIKTEITNTAGVSASVHGFNFINNLHGSDFWSATDGAGRERRFKHVEGILSGLELPFDIRYNMHNMGVPFNHHEIVYFHGTILAYASAIISA